MRPLALLLAALTTLAVTGCAGALLEVTPMRGAPASSRDYWTPASDDVLGATPLTGGEKDTYVGPEDVLDLENESSLQLDHLIDLALRNSPATRSTWSSARASAAAVGAARGSYYPQITMTGELTYSEGIASSGSEAFSQRDYGPEWSMSWLLFDFGGREATIRAALEGLVAENWQHDGAVLETVLTVAQSYYTLIGALRQVNASQLSVGDAAASVRAARARMNEHIGTAYDYLQAETTLAQIQIDLESYRGQAETARGALSTAVGLPANVPLAVGRTEARPNLRRAMGSVDEMIDVARRRRPALGAAWADYRAREAEVWAATATMLPSLSATGLVQRLDVESDAVSERGWPYSYGLSISIPIFTGLANVNTVREARATAEAARATAVEAEQTVIDEVWSSYSMLKTADAMVKTSDRWLDAARESYRAARVAYDNGLGNIIELLDAQIALATARSQVVAADTNWFTALAQLAHDVGLFSREASSDHLLHELSAPMLDSVGSPLPDDG